MQGMTRLFAVIGLTLILPLFVFNLFSFIFVNSYGDKLKFSYAIAFDFIFNMMMMLCGYYMLFKFSSLMVYSQINSQISSKATNLEMEMTKPGEKLHTVRIINNNTVVRVKIFSNIIMMGFMFMMFVYFGLYLHTLHVCPNGPCVNYPISCAELEIITRYNTLYRLLIVIVYFINSYKLSRWFKGIYSDKVILGIRP